MRFAQYEIERAARELETKFLTAERTPGVANVAGEDGNVFTYMGFGMDRVRIRLAWAFDRPSRPGFSLVLTIRRRPIPVNSNRAASFIGDIVVEQATAPKIAAAIAKVLRHANAFSTNRMAALFDSFAPSR